MSNDAISGLGGSDKYDERGRRIIKTISCPTPYCYGWQDIVEDPRAENGTVGVGGCRCGWLVDEEEYTKFLEESAS